MNWYSYFEFEIFLSKNYTYNIADLEKNLNQRKKEVVEIAEITEFNVISPRLSYLVITCSVKYGDFTDLKNTKKFLMKFFGNTRRIKSKLFPQGEYAASQLF